MNKPDPSVNRRPIAAFFRATATGLTRRCVALGIHPDWISYGSMVAAALAAVCFASAEVSPALLVVGSLFCFLRLWCNMLDGMVAVETGISSAIGELYNEMPDRISDAAILIGVGYAAGSSSTLGYIAVCVALFVAYVRSAVKTAGAPSDFCGPMAKQQRMLVVAGAAVFMGVMPFAWQFKWGPDNDWGIVAAALLVVIVGGLVTAVRRVAHAVRSLGQDLSQ